FFQAEDGRRDATVTGVQTCALPISEADRPEGVGAADRGRDSLHLGGRRRAEERGRDVEVVAGDDPAAREMPLLPRDERVEDLVRSEERRVGRGGRRWWRRRRGSTWT